MAVGWTVKAVGRSSFGRADSRIDGYVGRDVRAVRHDPMGGRTEECKDGQQTSVAVARTLSRTATRTGGWTADASVVWSGGWLTGVGQPFERSIVRGGWTGVGWLDGRTLGRTLGLSFERLERRIVGQACVADVWWDRRTKWPAGFRLVGVSQSFGWTCTVGRACVRARTDGRLDWRSDGRT